MRMLSQKWQELHILSGDLYVHTYKSNMQPKVR